MSNTKQTAVEFIINEFSGILGSIKTTPMQDMLILDAINKAKQMEKEQITTAWCEGNDAEPKEVTMDFAEEYYTQTYEN